MLRIICLLFCTYIPTILNAQELSNDPCDNPLLGIFDFNNCCDMPVKNELIARDFNFSSSPYCDKAEIVEISPELNLVSDDEFDTEPTINFSTRRCQEFEGKDNINLMGGNDIIKAYLYYGLYIKGE